jgi:PAS domain S-box-containing protein
MNKSNILVVEDEALIAASLVQTLSSIGYTVHKPVATGEDAIRSVKTRKPDLVLMDIELVGAMDGIETAEKIQAIADIPLVYLTAYTDDKRLAKARQTEPYGYIVKPAHNRELRATIEMALYKHALDRKLKESEERYRILTDAAHDVIYTLSPQGVVTYINSNGVALFGMPPEKIVGSSIETLFTPDIAQELRENLDTVISTKMPIRYDLKFWHEDRGQVSWFDAQLVPQFNPDGSVFQAIGISRGITDRKEAEVLLKRFNEELEREVTVRTAELIRTNEFLEAAIIQRTLAEESVRKSLNERELLLREIHHRVRNNLQIILSLIMLQSRKIKDPHLLDTLGEFQNRIMAMAHVHERMYLADDITWIDLSEIVTFMGTSLFESFKVNSQQIRLNVEIKDLHIAIDSAIPISLIINELISNSIKHAFPKGTSGEITIAGRREAHAIWLSVRDTGIGMPKDLDWKRNKHSLGHQLVVSLVEQLDGTIKLDRSDGTTFKIIIPKKPEQDGNHDADS